MELTIQSLKENGEYLGFSESLGYVYTLNGKMYSINGYGITNITNLEVAL